jgi:hypothetical protein
MKLLGISALLGVLAVTGCAGTAASQVGSVPAGAPSAVGVREDALSLLGPAPDKRQGCGVTKRYVIKSGGGAFPVPACSGWSGTIAYPNGNHRYIFGVTGSVTNNFGAPPPPSGTAIFYMQTKKVQPRYDPSFGDTGVTDTVTSPQLTSDHTYTLIVYGFILDSQCPTEPPSGCPPWVTNIGSPAPGSNSITFVSPLNSALLYGPLVWQFVQN